MQRSPPRSNRTDTPFPDPTLCRSLIASYIDRSRLSRLAPRAQRAGAGLIEMLLLDPGRELAAFSDLVGKVDCVLVDAPCSGTGTWRRKPEAKWRLTPERLGRFAATQDYLLDLAAGLVQIGRAHV